MEADAVTRDVGPIAVIHMGTTVADARIALYIVGKPAMGIGDMFATIVLEMARARIDNRHLVVVMEFGPTARQIVGAQCEVEQSVVGVGEVAVVNPDVVAVAHRDAVFASLGEDDVSEDDVVLVLHVDAYAVERLAATGTDDGLVGAN